MSGYVCDCGEWELGTECLCTGCADTLRDDFNRAHERCRDLEISNTYLLKIIEGDKVSNKALRESIKSVEAHNDTLRNALQVHGEEAAQLALISEELRKDDRRVLNKVADECDKK